MLTIAFPVLEMLAVHLFTMCFSLLAIDGTSVYGHEIGSLKVKGRHSGLKFEKLCF